MERPARSVRQTDPVPEEFREAVDAALAAELAARRAEVASVDRRLTSVVDRLVEFASQGGKRLRPEFLWWGWRAGGGRADPADCAPVVRIAAALELIQACALLHDDVIDRSETRRGRPSVHVAVAKEHADLGLSGDSGHYGTATALLLGDLALAWADDVFTAAAHQLRALDRAQPPWRGMRTEVLAGQLLDIRASAATPDPATQTADAMLVNRFKTAAYTVERPLHLGAALARARPAVVAALRAYGVAVGTAFQLRDDLLGVYGDPAVTGKPAGDDLTEGKRTVLLATARQRLADDSDLLRQLDAGLGSSDPATIARLTAIIAGSGAPDALETQISALVAQSNAALIGVPVAAAEVLRTLALRSTERRR